MQLDQLSRPGDSPSDDLRYADRLRSAVDVTATELREEQARLEAELRRLRRKAARRRR